MKALISTEMEAWSILVVLYDGVIVAKRNALELSSSSGLEINANVDRRLGQCLSIGKSTALLCESDVTDLFET